MLKVGVTGAAGRMGKTVIQAITQHDSALVSAAYEYEGAPEIGKDAGTLAGEAPAGVDIVSSLDEGDFEVLVDFSTIEASLHNAEYCAQNTRGLVVGTTGFDNAGRSRIQEASQSTAIMMAPNMSVGVNLCFHLIDVAARALGDSVDIEIIEAHHRHKIDAPSGTALRMGEVVADALDRDLSESAQFDRHGITEPRSRSTIGFSTIRAGDIVGDHTVLFASEGERVEITHKAQSRRTFADGAVRAAIWLRDKPPGLYNMQDVLGIG